MQEALPWDREGRPEEAGAGVETLFGRWMVGWGRPVPAAPSVHICQPHRSALNLPVETPLTTSHVAPCPAPNPSGCELPHSSAVTTTNMTMGSESTGKVMGVRVHGASSVMGT